MSIFNVGNDSARIVQLQDDLYDGNDGVIRYDNDLELIENIMNLISVRTFWIDRIVSLCSKLCFNEGFKGEFLKIALFQCPMIIYRLLIDGVYTLDMIMKELENTGCLFSSLYFCDYTENPLEYLNTKHYDRFLLITMIPQLIENNFFLLKEVRINGFPKSSIEYCLKFDCLDIFLEFTQNAGFNPNDRIDWSYFEWTKKPINLSYIHIAAYFGSLSIMKRLISLGSAFNSNVMSCAAFSGKSEFFYLLEQPNFDYIQCANQAIVAYRKNIFDWSISHSANHFDVNAAHCGIRFILFLIQHGRTFLDYEFLFEAISNNNYSLVSYFLKNGVSANTYSEHGMSFLHTASDCGYTSIVKLLLECGADVNILDNNKWSPMNFACLKGHYHVFDILCKNGGNINYINQEILLWILASLFFIMHQ